MHLNILTFPPHLATHPIMISHVLIWLNDFKLVSSTFLSSGFKYLLIMLALRWSFPPLVLISFIWWIKHLFLYLHHQTAYFDLRALHVFCDTHNRPSFILPSHFHTLFIWLSSSICFVFSVFSLTGLHFFAFEHYLYIK